MAYKLTDKDLITLATSLKDIANSNIETLPDLLVAHIQLLTMLTVNRSKPCRFYNHRWKHSGVTYTRVYSDLDGEYTKTSLWKECSHCGRRKKYKTYRGETTY